MAAEQDRSFTVGSLVGQPFGAPGQSAGSGRQAPAPGRAADAPVPPPGEREGRDWLVAGGDVRQGAGGHAFRTDGVEELTYNNPFAQDLERVWFDGDLVYAVDLGAVDVDASRVKVAQEYQIVYSVELDERGKWTTEPDLVPGQYNIYDSVPGMQKYSPIWQFNYVVVPREYVPNNLRSEADCLGSGYPVLRSNVFEN